MVVNVLSPATCRSIITSANTIGWEADQAAGGSAVDKTSVLAHNVVWLADEDFTGQLYERIRPFVQDSVPSEKDGRPLKVRGINRRFRVYRYGSRQVYRVCPWHCDDLSQADESSLISMAHGQPPACIPRQESTCTSESSSAPRAFTNR